MTDKKNEAQEYTNILKDLAKQYFDSEVSHAHELFSDAAWPKTDDPHYIKKTTFTVNARKAHLALLKTLAQHIAGVIPSSQTAKNKLAKKEADDLLAKAKARITEQVKQQAEIVELKTNKD